MELWSFGSPSLNESTGGEKFPRRSLLWMDKIMHHLENMGNHYSFGIYMIYMGVFPLGPLSWCRMSSVKQTTTPDATYPPDGIIDFWGWCFETYMTSCMHVHPQPLQYVVCIGGIRWSVHVDGLFNVLSSILMPRI